MHLSQQVLRLSKTLTILCVGVCIGWFGKDIYLNNQALTCLDYSTKYTMWLGHISTRNGDVRCFWLESTYPNRVRQGVPVQ